MATNDTLVSLRNDSAGTITIGTLSIGAGATAEIWDTVEYKAGVADNFQAILDAPANFNEGIGNGNLVMVQDTVDQTATAAWALFQELKESYYDQQIAIFGFDGIAPASDGNVLSVNYIPSNYTRSATPPDVTSVDQLGAHLAGIDNALANAVADHGALTGLGDDDHTQYLLTNGTRAMSGNLDMGSNAITDVTGIIIDSQNIDAVRVDDAGTLRRMFGFRGSDQTLFIGDDTGTGTDKHKYEAITEMLWEISGSAKITVTGSTTTFGNPLDMGTNNITNVGNVDGRDVSADGTTLDNHVASTANPHATDIGNLGSGTLAELNAAVTDATLDDSSSSRTPTAHASTHITGGSDVIDADQADITWVPSNYTRTTSPAEVTSTSHLTAHLAGIDNALASAGTVGPSRVYWVAKNGNDSNSGTESDPFLTVGAAMTAIGDAATTVEYEDYDQTTFVVHIGPGSYVENVTIPRRQYINIYFQGAAEIVGNLTYTADTSLGASSHPPRLTLWGGTNRPGFGTSVQTVGIRGDILFGNSTSTSDVAILDLDHVYVDGDIVCDAEATCPHTQIYGDNFNMSGGIYHASGNSVRVQLYLQGSPDTGSLAGIGSLGLVGRSNHFRFRSLDGIWVSGNIEAEGSSGDGRLTNCEFGGTINLNGSTATLTMDLVTYRAYETALSGTDTGTVTVLDDSTITAGAGLTGGGNTSTDPTLNVAANADGSIVVNADDIQVGVLATDAQHGNRGGGSLHSNATTGTSGFMSSADKTKLDGVESGAQVNTVDSVFGRTGAVIAAASDYDAVQIDYTNTTSGLTATDVQAAIDEVDSDLDNHVANTSNPHSTSIANVGSGTLAQLNAAVTDATLDDSSDPRTPTAHASTHITGGSDVIDADQADITWIPSNYTRSTSPAEVTSTSHLTAHLAGIDSELATFGALTSTAPVDVQKNTAQVGVSAEAARADHRHNISTASPATLTVGQSGSEGISNSLARADHDHQVVAGTPVAIGDANATGALNSFVRADHVHALGGSVGGDLSGTLPNPTVTDLTITGEEQGSVLYYSGTNWVQLPPGAAGQVLTTNGTGSNPNWASAGGGVTDHGALTGLGDDDHTQYLLTNGTRAMTGSLNMGTFAITNVGNVDGRDISADGTTLDNHVANTSNPHSTSIANIGSGTLAQLNAAVSDATLDDSSSARTPTAHASTHITGGSDVIDADQADITYVPSNYTRTTSPAEVTSTSHLTAHLAGIDDALATLGDVTGPGTSTDNSLVRWDGTGGTAIQNSGWILDDAGNLTAGGGVLDMSFEGITNVDNINGVIIESHAARHVSGGADEINGDHLDIDWNPTYYTPTTAPAEASSVDHLTAHLAGIDSAINDHVFDQTNPHETTLAGLNDTSIAPSASWGSILYKGSSLWQVLAEGTSGQFLQTQGANSPPQWASISVDASNVSYDPSSSYLVATDVQAAIDEMTALNDLTQEPSGFPNRTDSSISKNDGTRTFTIQPAVTSYDIYIKGEKITKSSAENVVWTTAEGLHFFGFDNTGTLVHTTAEATVEDWILGNGAYISALYWDSTNSQTIFWAEERHGLMDGETHLHFHTSFGAQWTGGGELQNITANGDGSSNSHAQFSVEDVSVADEDIRLSYTDGSPQDLSPIAQIPIYYRDGASGNWRKKTATDYPLIESGTAGYTGGSGRIAYNQDTGSAWQLTEATNNYYVLVHYFVGNEINEPVVGILGQTEYSTLSGATSASARASLDIAGLEDLFAKELALLGTVIFNTSGSYTNAVKAVVQAPDSSVDYFDYRNGVLTAASQSSGGGGAAGVQSFPIAACTTTAINVEQNDAIWGSLVIPLVDVTISKLEVQVTQTASGNVYCAIYDSSFNLLGDDSTGVSVGSTGLKVSSLNSVVNLTAGTAYYLCARCDGNGSRFSGTTTTANVAVPQYSIRKDNGAPSSFPSSFTSPATNSDTLWIVALE